MAKNGNPVMVVIDDANFLTQGCYLQVYVDPEKIRAYPDQRGLPHWSTRLGLKFMTMMKTFYTNAVGNFITLDKELNMTKQ